MFGAAPASQSSATGLVVATRVPKDNLGLLERLRDRDRDIARMTGGARVIIEGEEGQFENELLFREAMECHEEVGMLEAVLWGEAVIAIVNESYPDLADYPAQILRKLVRSGADLIPVIFDGENEVDVQWAPQPGSQQLFMQDMSPELLYEGTRGPGKTDGLVMDFCQHVGEGFGAEWRGLILRNTFPQLSDIIDKSRKWIKRIWPEATFNSVSSTWSWPSGETLRFSHFNTRADYDGYHGHAYPWIGWEELTNWPNPDSYKSMFSVNRSTVKRMPLKIRATTNPYGVGHNWVKQRWALPTAPGAIITPLIVGATDDKGNREPPRRAVHGYLDENIILLSAEGGYKDKLRAAARNTSELAAWMDGSWDIVAGGMFDDIWATHAANIIMEPFDTPVGWKIYRAYDHGSSKPFSVGWYAVSDGTDLKLRNGKVRATVRGDVFRIHEWYGNRGGQPNEGLRMLTSEIAKGIITREISWGLRDPRGTWHRVTQEGPADTGIFDEANGGLATIAEDFARPCVIDHVRHSGIRWSPADKGPHSREQGWEQLRKRLKATKPEAGTAFRETPGLFISTDCPDWLRCVPVLPRDEKKFDDVNSDAEDHSGDETRYFLRFDTTPSFRNNRRTR